MAPQACRDGGGQDQVTRTAQTVGRMLLGALLCLSLLAWSILPTMSHVPRIAEVLDEHAWMTADHGHSHGLPEDLLRAFHGHGHDAIDHDHSPALPVVASGGEPWPTARDDWRLPTAQAGPQRIFRIERPPRA